MGEDIFHSQTKCNTETLPYVQYVLAPWATLHPTALVRAILMPSISLHCALIKAISKRLISLVICAHLLSSRMWEEERMRKIPTIPYYSIRVNVSNYTSDEMHLPTYWEQVRALILFLLRVFETGSFPELRFEFWFGWGLAAERSGAPVFLPACPSGRPLTHMAVSCFTAPSASTPTLLYIKNLHTLKVPQLPVL